MKLPIYQVDAFTSKLFGGNPAAVIFCSADFPAETMQAIAAENNLAETAFVFNGPEGYAIRWFTPMVEVDLCGHATLAAAHVLFVHRGLAEEAVTFQSRSGPLHVRRRDGRLWLDFPADRLTPVEPPAELAEALGVPVREVLRGRDDLMAVVDGEAVVHSLTPDLPAIAGLQCRGLIVTSHGNSVDFVSRFFAPQSGIPEDQVTGSAHTSLIPYWAERQNRRELTARQLSPRGGDLQCLFKSDRVEMGGNAVTFLIGEILV